MEIREPPVEWITVQQNKSILKMMKENGVTPYVLPKNRSLHQKVIEDERLTSEDEEGNEQSEVYHKGPQISSDESEYI